MSTPQQPGPESSAGPKIIVDDDWKSRVQAEKEAARRSSDEVSAGGGPGGGPSSGSGQPPGEEGTRPAAGPSRDAAAGGASSAKPVKPPPASFALLVSTLATEALAAMGQLAGPHPSQPPQVQLEVARHFIDTLAMLEEKTKGNLSREEASLLESVLHELRLAFVAASRR
jgi:hypothetical protein